MWVLSGIIFLFGILLSNQDIAEMEKKFMQTPEAEKSIVLNKLVNKLLGKSWDDKQKEKILAYARQAIEYARKYNQKDREVYALANLCKVYRRLKRHDKAIHYAQKSLDLAEKRKIKKEIIFALELLAGNYAYIPDFPKAVTLYERKKALHKEIDDKRGEAMCLHIISNFHAMMGETGGVIEQKKEALKLFLEVRDYDSAALTLEGIAVGHRSLGDNKKALEYFLKGLSLAEENNIPYRAGRIYYQLGKFYKDLKQYQKSFQHFSKALDSFKHNEARRGRVFKGLGNLFSEQGDYDQALIYLEKSWQIASKNSRSIYNSLESHLLEMGRLYYKKKEYRKAISKYREALDICINIKDIHSEAKCRNLLAEAQLMENNLKNAFDNLSKSMEIGKKEKHIQLMKESYRLLCDYYEKIGNYKSALAYHRLYVDLNLKIYNEESAKNLADMQTKYETEKKEKEIELLKKKEEIRELSLSKQKILRNVSIAGFVLLFIVMIFFVKKYYYLLIFWKKKNVIGSYKVMDKIGSGGMGIVYKAHDVRDKTKTFAIKVLREEYFDDENYKKRFKHEALVTDQLNHPNIIKINERGETAGNLYIAMELLSGKTLDEKLLEEGRIDLQVCVHIMKQVAGALVSIHGKNIIHRDLKPANIMLIEKDGDENYVKLLDFGLARAEFQTRLTRTGIMVGTTNYLSPEQITNSGLSTVSDIFSLGIVFYEMVCGSKPFFGESESDIIMAILDTVPVDPKKIRPETPVELSELIKKMLAKDKESRPSSQDILEILKTI